MDLLKFSRQATQLTLSPEDQTIEITLPVGCRLPMPASDWTKQSDGKIAARYTRYELLTALATVDWLEPGADQLSLRGLAIYARLRIGENLIAGAVDGRQVKLINHWCQLWSELAIIEPDLVGGVATPEFWRQWTHEVSSD